MTFHDTLQKLALRVVRLNHVKDQLEQNRKKIKVLELLTGTNPIKFVEHFDNLNINKDYQRCFDEMLFNLKQSNKKIELVEQLRIKTRHLNKTYN